MRSKSWLARVPAPAFRVTVACHLVIKGIEPAQEEFKRYGVFLLKAWVCPSTLEQPFQKSHGVEEGVL
jgi:hypothetical protein